MIELLVVITVITIMASLVIAASWRFVVGSREAATATTITKVSGIIQDRVRAFREFDFTDAAINFLNTPYLTGAAASTYSYTNPVTGLTIQANLSSTVTDAVLAEVLIRKIRYKKAFPQAFLELDQSQCNRFFPTLVYATAVASYASNKNFTGAGTYNPKYESGIILYAVIMNGETFGAATPSPDTFTGAEIKTAPETGNLPCLVDSWGEPLRFYRWPTRLIRCAEQSYQSSDGTSSYDDFNQNGAQDAGGLRVTAPPSTPAGIPVLFGITGSAPSRPCTLYSGPTPASLLMSTLPPYNRNTISNYSTGIYIWGPDLKPGVALCDDDVNGTVDDASETGWPGSDDPESLNIDPDDPTFRLSSLVWTYQNTLMNLWHDFYTFHTPLIVSAGQDRQLGLYEPSDTTNFGALAAPLIAPTGSTAYNTTIQYLLDDISNHNQKAGGK